MMLPPVFVRCDDWWCTTAEYWALFFFHVRKLVEVAERGREGW